MSRRIFSLVSVMCLVSLATSPCAAQWVWQNPLPQGNYLSAIWGSDWADVFAVGASGTILRGDGFEWSAMDSGTGVWLNGVWGTASNDVFVVGDDGTILRYDGSTWSPMNSGISEGLRGIWGSSGNDIFVVGREHEGLGGVYSGTILHYDGSSWSSMTSHSSIISLMGI